MGKMKDLELLFEYADELQDRLNKALAEIEAKGVSEEYVEWRNRQDDRTLGFEEHYIEGQKNIEEDLPF